MQLATVLRLDVPTFPGKISFGAEKNINLCVIKRTFSPKNNIFELFSLFNR